MPMVTSTSHSNSSSISSTPSAPLNTPSDKSNALKSPVPTPKHLFLSRAFTASSLTLNNSFRPDPNSRPSTPTLPKTPHTPGKFRSQINHLLPKHAYFQVRVEIQQLASVPFVRGEFGVRWKFKGVHRHASGYVGGLGDTPIGQAEGSGKEVVSGKGLLGRVKARRDKGKTRGDGDSGMDSLAGAMMKEFGMSGRTGSNLGMGSSSALSHPPVIHQDSLSSNYSTTSRASATSSSSYRDNSSLSTYPSISTSPKSIFGSSQYLFHTSPPSPHQYGQSLAGGLDPSFASNSAQYASSSTFFSQDPLSPRANNAGPLSPVGSVLSSTGTITPGNLNGTGQSPSRGITPYLPLKDHSITFNYPLTAVLKLDVQRGEDKKLLENEFKVVIMQRVIPDDPDGVPQNPRLGAVYLNLSEYVDKGKVERRYLLRDSRVNATLKLSIEVTYLSGDADYVAPPLPKTEILSGIQGFLENDAYRTRPRSLDLYGPYKDQEELDLDLLGMRKNEGTEAQDNQIREARKAKRKQKKYQIDDNPYALPPSESESDFSRMPPRGRGKSRKRPKPLGLDAESEFQRNPYALPDESESATASGSESDEDTDYSYTDDRESMDSPENQSRSQHSQKKVPNAIFDVQRLPVAYGTKTTEALIEALFNPVLTTERRQEGPFTFYVPPEVADVDGKGLRSPGEETIVGVGLGIHMRQRDMDATIGRSAGGMSLGQKNKERKEQRNPRRSGTGVSTASTEDGATSSMYTTSTTSNSTTGSGSASGGSSRSASLRSAVSSSSRVSHANPNSVSGAGGSHTRGGGGSLSSRSGGSGSLPDGIPVPLPPSSNSKLSVPDGRMDKTGVVAGSGAGGGEESTFNLRGWWRGFGMKYGGEKLDRSGSGTPIGVMRS